MDRKKMKKVRSFKKLVSTKVKVPQLGILDEQTGQLLVDVGGYTKTLAGNTRELVASGSVSRALVPSNPPPNQAAVDAEEELTEEELTRKFAEQTAKIQDAFDHPVQEPTSLMRAPPFTMSAFAEKLMHQNPNAKQEDESSIIGGNTSSAAERVSSSARPSGITFLTGVGDESSQSRNLRLGSSASATSLAQTPSQTGGSSYAGSPFGSQPPPGLIGAGFGNTSAVLSESSILPPIHSGAPGSRGSSASVSRSDPLDFLMNPVGRTKQMPDVGVRDAMKALRAAAMSEYAVAV
jgi:hypothetical protein